MLEKDRSYLRLIRGGGGRQAYPQDLPPTHSLQRKRQQNEAEEFAEVREMAQGAQRILQREFLGKLPPDQAQVMWGVFSLKSEKQIAKEMGITLGEVRKLRDEAEHKFGGRLNFNRHG